MSLIGSIAGGVVGAAGSIYGGISASKAMKKVKKNLEKQQQANQDWYDQRYNEDATQRADAQRILTKTEETFRDRNRASQGTAAVMGGTEESVAATKAANAQAMADAASQIDVAGEARKDQIEQTYQENDRNIQSQLNDLEIQKANATAQAVQGVGETAGNLISAFL